MTVYLRDVPEEVSRAPHHPFIMFGLLQHEHKKSVLNFTVQRNTEYDGSVRSKVCNISFKLHQKKTHRDTGSVNSLCRASEAQNQPYL